MPRDHGHGASASHGVAVYVPAFASTKLYCFVIEAHGCEQCNEGCYLTARWLGIELVTASQMPQPLDYQVTIMYTATEK